MAVALLDTDQLACITVPPEARQIVLAGPGAGKSEVVGAIAAELTCSGGIYPDEILVISFSRAAVSVVEQRTSGVVDEGDRVDVRTIDSLASQLIDEATQGDQPFKSYEHSIELATQLLVKAPEPIFGHLRHVIVDEVQDVVGARADFVLALLKKGIPDDAGFTLLGDPLQSLYDFQLTAQHPKTCQEFLDEVSKQFKPDLIRLVGDHRSRTDDAATATRLRSHLLALDPHSRLRTLTSALADLPPLGTLDADAVETVATWPGRTALLCDTNARAALTAARLSDHGLASETAAPAHDSGLPPWLATVLADHTSSTMDFDEFLRLATDSSCPNPTEAWRSLRDRNTSRPDLDIRRVAADLGTPSGHSRFRRTTDADIVVSTVHRAKGLEFDNTVLVDPTDWRAGGDDSNRSSMLYVAISRAHSRVTVVDGVDTQQWIQESRGSRPLWVRRAWGRRGWLGLLLEPWMTRALGPSKDVRPDHIGSSVEWEHHDPWIVDGEEIPSWIATIDGAAVARTGEEFGRILGRISQNNPPNLIGGRFDGVETMVGHPRDNGPGQHGLWLSARIAGPIDLKWK